MLNTGFSPWPCFTEEEADAAKRVLLSNRVNYWTGEEVKSFEKEFARWLGCEYAVALANGTVALECALEALGVNRGDQVITSPRTFFATASSIVRVGAQPVFVDVDKESQNIHAESIEPAVTEKTKAVIVVHLAGVPAEMDAIMRLAERYNLYVIEDCAQAHGAKYKDHAVGTIGHIGAWSFCQDKIMTTGGEGGMVTTNDRGLWKRMWALKDHGKSYDAVYSKSHAAGFRWLHEGFGTNWRMTEMQGAIGRIQLRCIDDWLRKRNAHSQKIIKAVSDIACVHVPKIPDYTKPAWYKLYLFLRIEMLKEGWTRDRVINEIVNKGVPCFQGSCSEVYLEKAFDQVFSPPLERLDVARLLGETSLMFLVHPSLTDNEIMKTCDVVRQVLLNAQAA